MKGGTEPKAIKPPKGANKASLSEANAKHHALVHGTHYDKGSAEHHFRAMHAQVMGKKS